MSKTTDNMVRLCQDLAAHQKVTHWAISMRMFGKGDFFAKLISGERKGCHTETAETSFQWFSDNWPSDLDWPAHIARPKPAIAPSKETSS